MGCGGEQFGGTTDDGDPIKCVSVRVTELEADEVSPLGFSPDEIMSFVGGGHESSFDWGPGAQRRSELSVSPTPGATTLTVEVESKGARYRFVERSLEEGSTWAGDEEIACPDELRIQTEVSLASDNGAFDETVEMELVASSPLGVKGELDLLAHDSQTRQFELLQQGAELLSAKLSLAWTVGRGFSGQAVVAYETRSDSATGQAASIFLARFPEESVCREEAVALPNESEPVVALDSLLSEMKAMKVEWDVSEREELVLALQAEHFCVDPPAPYVGRAGGLSFEAVATVSGAEGSAEATWSLAGTASSSAGGSVSALSLSLDAEGSASVSASMFESQYGLAVEGLADHDEARLLVELAWDEELKWSGNITVQARSQDDPCHPGNETHPISPECIVDGAHHAGWKNLDSGRLSFE